MLRAEDTAALARDLIRDNETVLRTLKDNGAWDLSVLAAGSVPFPRQRVPPARHASRS